MTSVPGDADREEAVVAGREVCAHCSSGLEVWTRGRGPRGAVAVPQRNRSKLAAQVPHERS